MKSEKIQRLARTSFTVAATCWGGDRDSISPSDTSVIIDSSMIDSSAPQEQRVSKLKNYAKALIVMSGVAAIFNIYNGDNAGNSGSHDVGMTMKTMEERRLTPDHIRSVQAPLRGITEDYLDHTNLELYDQELQPQSIAAAKNLNFFRQENTVSTANIDENLSPNNSNNNSVMSTTTNAMLNEIDPNLRGGHYSGETTGGSAISLASLGKEQPSQSQQPPLPSSPKQRQMVQEEQKVIQNKMEMEDLGLARQKAFEEIADQWDNDDAITPTFSTTSEKQEQQATEEEDTRLDVMVEQPPQVQDATEESNAVQEQEKAEISDNVEQGGVTDREEQAKQEEQLNQVGQQETLQQEQAPTSVTAEEFKAHEVQAKQQDQDQVEQRPPQQQLLQQEQTLQAMEQLPTQSEVGGVRQEAMAFFLQTKEYMAKKQDQLNQVTSAVAAEFQAQEDQANQRDTDQVEQPPLLQWPLQGGHANLQEQLDQVEQQAPQQQQKQVDAPPTMELPTQAEMEAARKVVTEEAQRIAVQEEARQKTKEEENLIVAREEARQTITEEENLQKAASAKADSQEAQLQKLSERALVAVERGRSILQVTTGTMVTGTGADAKAEEEDLWSEFSELEQVLSQEQQQPVVWAEQR